MLSRVKIKAQSSNRLLPRKHGPQVLRDMFELIRKSPYTVHELAEKAGVDYSNLSDWGRVSIPRLDSFEATVNALGYKLVIQKS